MTYRTPYASITTGPPQHRGGSIIRIDQYAADDGRTPVSEHVFAADLHDDSPQHATYPTGYDAACSCCWLGFAHSDRCHAANIARK